MIDYELVNLIQPTTENWEHQKKRAIANKSMLITLAPDPLFLEQKQTEYDRSINLIDYITQRSYNPESSLFFDRIETVDNAEITMNIDGVISIISDGVEIGQVSVYPETRRLVQSIKGTSEN